MEIAVACKAVSGTLIDVKAEIHAIKQVVGRRCFPLYLWNNGARFKFNGVYWDHKMKKCND